MLVGNEIRSTINSREWISNLGAQPTAARIFQFTLEGDGVEREKCTDPHPPTTYVVSFTE